MYNGDKIDKVLRDAAEQARIPNGLTHKLGEDNFVLWIDPGCVSVKYTSGEHKHHIHTLYQKPFATSASKKSAPMKTKAKTIVHKPYSTYGVWTPPKSQTNNFYGGEGKRPSGGNNFSKSPSKSLSATAQAFYPSSNGQTSPSYGVASCATDARSVDEIMYNTAPFYRNDAMHHQTMLYNVRM